jgi:hypothetical protein
MKRRTTLIGVVMVFCALAVLIGAASAGLTAGHFASMKSGHVSSAATSAGSGNGLTGMARPALTAAQNSENCGNATGMHGNGHRGDPVALVESLGHDTSELKALIESGDRDAIKTWMDAFFAEHKDELPAPPQGKGPCRDPVALVESLGHDASELKGLIESADRDAIKTWMDAFFAEHKDELPVPPEKPSE